MRRRVAVLLVLALTLAGVAPAAGGTAGAGVDDRTRDISAQEPGVSALQAENNTTRHQDPETVGDDGNLAAVRSNLAGRMGEISVDCSEGIRIGNYDACEELNGSYSDALSKYVDVTGREAGGSENDRRSGESFDDLQEQTREFANETRRFRQTYREYREARRNGNTTRARRLARELLQLRQDIQRSGANVTRSADDIGNRTGVSLEAVSQSTQAVTANVSNTTDTVVTDVFVRTQLTATRAGDGNVSAREPLVVTGQVRTANDTTVRNGSVVLATGPGRGSRIVDRTRVSVDDSGAYRLSYRPTTIRTGDRTLSVWYRPPATSIYLSANESADATVEQVRATVTVAETPDATRYREPVRAVAKVSTADGDAIDLEGVPLQLRVDGRTLATSRTNATGAVLLQSRLPAGITPGERTLRLTGLSGNRAVTVEPATRAIRVESTVTTLEARTVQTAVGERSLRVVGRLQASGAGVPAQDLEVRLDGQLIRTLETNATGYYRGTVAVPNASFPATGRETVEVVLAFDGAGTNLERASVRQEVGVRSGVAASSEGGLSRALGFVRANPVVAGGGVVVVGLLAAGLVVGLRRRGGETVEDAGAVGGSTDATGKDASLGADGVPGSQVDVEAVEAALSGGAYAQAVLSGYAAVRRELPVADASTITHWEFYRRAIEAGLSESQLEALHTVTEAFERVSFAGQSPDEADAASVFEAVRDALGDGGEHGGDAAAADD